MIEVETDVEDSVPADDKVTEIKGLVASTGLDPRIAVKFRGEEQRAAETFLLKAFTDDLEPGTYCPDPGGRRTWRSPTKPSTYMVTSTCD